MQSWLALAYHLVIFLTLLHFNTQKDLYARNITYWFNLEAGSDDFVPTSLTVKAGEFRLTTIKYMQDQILIIVSLIY